MKCVNEGRPKDKELVVASARFRTDFDPDCQAAKERKDEQKLELSYLAGARTWEHCPETGTAITCS
jgi:hypothetical protein